MGTLVLLFCRAVLGFDAAGGDYHTIALTASLDTIALVVFLTWRQQKQTAVR